MNGLSLGHWTCFAVELFFIAILALGLGVGYGKQIKQLKSFLPLLLIVSVIGVLLALPDMVALRWGAWFYNPAKTIGFKLFGEPETYLGAFILYFIGSGATILSMKQEDETRNRAVKKRSRKQLSLWPRRPVLGFVVPRR